LRATELAVVDDPTVKQRTVQDRAGAYAGAKKYGESANLPATTLKKRAGFSASLRSASPGHGSSSSRSGGPSVPSPLAQGGGSTGRSAGDRRQSLREDPLLPSFEERTGNAPSRGASKVHKPHLDEMHGPESLPYRPGRAPPSKPFGDTSKIIQPTNSRESGPEFGPAPRSSGGAPGKRGGWKKR
ncbi:MAG: excinuclease ABC subunit UvrB, partial [Bradyrhizobium sp.]|nr:excinuclease ABC subunit UvrB [Bradyrhizobium sp.]